MFFTLCSYSSIAHFFIIFGIRVSSAFFLGMKICQGWEWLERDTWSEGVRTWGGRGASMAAILVDDDIQPFLELTVTRRLPTRFDRSALEFFIAPIPYFSSLFPVEPLFFQLSEWYFSSRLHLFLHCESGISHHGKGTERVDPVYLFWFCFGIGTVHTCDFIHHSIPLHIGSTLIFLASLFGTDLDSGGVGRHVRVS